MKECPNCFSLFDSNVTICLECNVELTEKTEEQFKVKGLYKLVQNIPKEFRLVDDDLNKKIYRRLKYGISE